MEPRPSRFDDPVATGLLTAASAAVVGAVAYVASKLSARSKHKD